MKNQATRIAARLAVAGFAMSLAVALPVVAVGQAPTKPATPPAGPWKVISAPDAGISVLLPPDAAFKYDNSNDAKTGEKTVLAEVQVQADGADPYYYIVEAFRANQAVLDDLKATSPEYKNPVAALVDKSLKPFLSNFAQAQKGDAKPPTMTRKPIVWSGMEGEDITITQESGPHKGSYGRLRVLKMAKGFIFLFAGERKQAPANMARIKKFMDSLVVSPDDPLATSAAAATSAAP